MADFQNKGTFTVEIDGIAVAKFQKADGLSAEIGEAKYRQGGSRIAHKQPGASVDYGDVTLSRGTFKGSAQLWNWFNQCNNAAAGTGGKPSAVNKTVDIVQTDRDGSRVHMWRCFVCWPKKFVPGTFDADSNDPQIQELTLAMDYFLHKAA